MVLVATSSSAETVPLQPNQRPPWRLSNERTATASPPAWLSPLGTATRLETTISRANIDPPSCATAASRSRSSRPSNRFAENFPQSPGLRIDILRQQAIAIAICQRVDEQLMRLLAATERPPGIDQPESANQEGGGRQAEIVRRSIAHNMLLAQKFALHRLDRADEARIVGFDHA